MSFIVSVRVMFFVSLSSILKDRFVFVLRSALPCVALGLLLALAASCRKKDKPAAHSRQDASVGLEIFEVLERSEFPNPRSCEYADCLFTARLRVLEPKDGSEARIVMGVIPAFRGRICCRW